MLSPGHYVGWRLLGATPLLLPATRRSLSACLADYAERRVFTGDAELAAFIYCSVIDGRRYARSSPRRRGRYCARRRYPPFNYFISRRGRFWRIFNISSVLSLIAGEF